MNPTLDGNFSQFLMTESPQIPLLNFSINLVLTAIVSYFLSQLYIKYGNSLSNRKLFSKNLILISVTTMVIITIVKSSLALSLGLVGALSIVRFRAAIKEPEELAYLFMAIAIGLGFGADQGATIFTAFGLISVFIVLRNYNDRNKAKSKSTSLYLTLRSSAKNSIQIDDVVTIFESVNVYAQLRRLDESADFVELVFNLHISDVTSLKLIQKDLKNIDPAIEISVIDQEGVIL